MKKSQLSLKWLEVFLLTARNGSLQEAADEAGLSVSTVSHHLRSLETRLGVSLIDHNRRPLRVTATGAVFQRHVEEALRLLRKAEIEAQSGSLAETRNLSLALVEDFDSEIAPELARILTAGMPGCAFRHLTRPSHEILSLLRSQEIDIGIAARPNFDPDDLLEYPLLRDPFVLAVPASSDRPPEAYLDGSCTLPLLRYSGNQIIASQIEQQLRRLRIALPGRFEFESNQTLMNMVAEGDGWAITTPANFFRARRFHRQIDLIPFPGKGFARYISVFTTEFQAQKVTEMVTETMRRLIEMRAIAPAIERLPWLAEQFRLLPATPPARDGEAS